MGSGRGTRADWYRNVQAGSPFEVQTGGDRYRPIVRVLRPEENRPILDESTRRLPRLGRPLAYQLGLDVKVTELERRSHGERLLFIAFRPFR